MARLLLNELQTKRQFFSNGLAFFAAKKRERKFPMTTKPPYQQSPEDLYAAYTSNREGLTSQQAKQNQERYGKNKLAEKKKKPIWLVFLEQFKDFLVIILIIAAIVSAITGELESTIVILFVITMNAILGTVQTIKAEKSLDNLKSLSAPHAKVLRDGTTVLLPAEELVVGDVILLEAGDQVPADARVLESASLQTNESALTGESLNVEKEADCIDQEVPLGDRKNMVYSGGFVTYGRGVCLVTSVGMETEVGKIAALMQNASERKNTLTAYARPIWKATFYCHSDHLCHCLRTGTAAVRCTEF